MASRRLWQAVPPSTREKGGADGCLLVLLPKSTNELPQRIVRVAEEIGDFLLRMPFHEDGAQRFVLTVVRLGRLGKELPATNVIHDQVSLKNVSWFSRKNKKVSYRQNLMGSMWITAKPGEKPLRTGPVLVLSGGHEPDPTENQLTATPTIPGL
jgi:hypothetical protein